MNKKILSLSLAAAVILSLSACNSAETEQPEVTETTSTVTETTVITTETSAETTAQTEQSETTAGEDEIIDGDELIYNTGDSLVWYVIENGKLIDLQKVNEINHRFNLYDKTDRQNRCQLTHSQILKNRQP